MNEDETITVPGGEHKTLLGVVSPESSSRVVKKGINEGWEYVSDMRDRVEALRAAAGVLNDFFQREGYWTVEELAVLAEYVRSGAVLVSGEEN